LRLCQVMSGYDIERHRCRLPGVEVLRGAPRVRLGPGAASDVS
jgi:hypothetical protein